MASNQQSAAGVPDPPATAAERAAAETQIVKWRGAGRVSGDDDTLIRLYLALKQSAGSGRITPKQIMDTQRTIRQTRKLSRAFYVVDRESKPDLPNDPVAKEWLWDVNLVENFPDEIDPEDIWLVDDGCPRQVLARPIWTSVGPILKLLGNIAREFPRLVRPDGHALLELHKSSTDALQAGSRDIVQGMKYKDLPAFFQSKLYESYLQAREQSRLDALMASGASAEQKLVVIGELLDTVQDEAQVATLQFGKAYFSLKDDVLVKWLLESKDRFVSLQRWEPGSKYAALAPFADACTKWRKVTFHEFAAAAEMIVQHGAAGAIAHPSAKAVVEEIGALAEAASGAAAASPEAADFVVSACHRLLVELCVAKLGLAGEPPLAARFGMPDSVKAVVDTDEIAEGALREHLASGVVAVAVPIARRAVKPGASPGPVASAFLAAFPQVAKDSPAKLVAAAGKELDQAPKGAATASGEGQPESEETSPFQVGDLVKTSSRKNKEMWNGMGGKVVALTKKGKGAKVLLLEGPAKDKTQDFALSALTKVEFEDAPVAADPVAVAQDGDAQRSKREAAAKLFGIEMPDCDEPDSKVRKTA